MKSLNTTITAVLAIAVIILFVLHFTSRQDLAEVQAQQADTTPDKTFELPKNLQGAKVLYVNIDSINSQYHAYTELAQEAEGSMQGQMAAYQRKAQDLQDRYTKLQEQVNMGTISAEAATAEEAAVNAGLDELKRMETNLAYLESAAMQKNDAISQEIALYFHDYALSKGIDYIMMYGTGMPIIYANDSLDVTRDVVIALNEVYDARKAQGAAAPTGKK